MDHRALNSQGNRSEATTPQTELLRSFHRALRTFAQRRQGLGPWPTFEENLFLIYARFCVWLWLFVRDRAYLFVDLVIFKPVGQSSAPRIMAQIVVISLVGVFSMFGVSLVILEICSGR